jgi:hypothetical protein
MRANSMIAIARMAGSNSVMKPRYCGVFRF